MAERSVPVKYLDDITECPICTNIFSDPRVLPCIHTFCLKCIEGWEASRKPDEQKLACPLCRKEITATREQLTLLPKNLFVEKLLEVKKLSGGLAAGSEAMECDVCTGGKKSSIAYCIECQLNMCLQCKEVHSKIRVCSSHRFVELRSQVNPEELLVKLSTSMCDKHHDKPMEVYCVECKTVMCLMCYIKGHKTHDCSDISEVAEELSQQLKVDCGNIDKKAAEYKNRIDKLAEKEKTLLGKTNKVENEIVERIEEMKRWIERRKGELLNEVESLKRKEKKKIENLRHELEGRLMMIDSFKKYSDQLRAKGSACDIAREVGSLHGRANELLELGSTGDLEKEGQPVDVTFISVALSENFNETIGKLNVHECDDKSLEDYVLSCKKPLLVVPSTGKRVGGISTLGDEVFVVRNGVKHVDVYDAATMNVQRQLQLSTTATGGNYGLVACPVNKCVYVADHSGNCVHKVNVDGKTPATNWSVGQNPLGVSLTTNNNVLVTSNSANKIQEYTTLGVLVREISLQSSITSPSHAVQLANGQYGVTHGGPYQGYSVVDSNGQIVKSYGNVSTALKLSNPRGIAISRCGFVFVTQHSGTGIVVIDGSTFTSQLLNIDGGISGTWCVHVDHTRGRLYMYIGEWNNGRVIVLGRA